VAVSCIETNEQPDGTGVVCEMVTYTSCALYWKNKVQEAW